MNYYTILNASGYKDGGKELEKGLNKLGFEYRQGEFGSGPEEVREVVIAWLSFHPLLAGLVLGVLANRIDGLLMFFYNWHLSNKKKDEDFIPIVNIAIYPTRFKRKSFTVKLKINKRYSKIELIKEIKKTKKIYKN